MVLKPRQWYWVMGFSTCLSLLLEEKVRRREPLWIDTHYRIAEASRTGSVSSRRRRIIH